MRNNTPFLTQIATEKLAPIYGFYTPIFSPICEPLRVERAAHAVPDRGAAIHPILFLQFLQIFQHVFRNTHMDPL